MLAMTEDSHNFSKEDMIRLYATYAPKKCILTRLDNVPTQSPGSAQASPLASVPIHPIQQ
jgi:hypothetical protein